MAHSMDGMIVAACLAGICAGTAIAEPPDADLGNWRGPCYNCYNYAVNSKDVYFAQLAPPFTCDNMRTQVIASGLVAVDWSEGDPIPECDSGCLVALVADIDDADPDNHDFHWYRLNANGRWSHKQGQRPATEHGGGGQAPGTWDPTQAAARGSYETFCGFFCVPTGEDLELEGTLSWELLDFLARLREMQQSGVEPPPLDLDFPMIKPLYDRLPSGIPVPDPQWEHLPGFGGLSLQFSPLLDPTLPPYLVVNAGIVAVYNNLDGPFVNIQYVADDRGLEPYLRSLLGGSEGCNPADLAPPYGVLDLADINAFVAGFINQDPATDIAPPFGVWDLADINAFAEAFGLGCP